MNIFQSMEDLLHCPEHDLSKILCHKETRKISKNLEVQYKNVIYQIIAKKLSWSMRGATVTIIEEMQGQIHIQYKNSYLPFEVLSQQDYNGMEVDSKEINRFLNQRKEHKVPYNHPWMQEGRASAQIREWAAEYA